MRLAVTDACIFIDLYNLALLDQFFSLKLEIHTTIDVINEMYPAQKLSLDRFVIEKKLIVHIITENDKLIIRRHPYSRALSEADKSALHVSGTLNACILSSDNLVRKTARKYGIDCHGILWIFDQLIESGILREKEPAIRLNSLSLNNKMFQSDLKLQEEIKKRIDKWNP